MSEENKHEEKITTATAAGVSKMNIDDATWDACIDLGARRVVYSSFAGALGGLLLFRSPVTRWAAVALGAGIGLGSAYTECSYKLNNFSTKPGVPITANDSSTKPAIPITADDSSTKPAIPVSADVPSPQAIQE